MYFLIYWYYSRVVLFSLGIAVWGFFLEVACVTIWEYFRFGTPPSVVDLLTGGGSSLSYSITSVSTSTIWGVSASAAGVAYSVLSSSSAVAVVSCVSAYLSSTGVWQFVWGLSRQLYQTFLFPLLKQLRHLHWSFEFNMPHLQECIYTVPQQ